MKKNRFEWSFRSQTINGPWRVWHYQLEGEEKGYGKTSFFDTEKEAISDQKIWEKIQNGKNLHP